MLEEDLNMYLRASGAGSACGSRIFPMQVPDDQAYPAVTYRMVSRSNVHSLTGASQLEMPRVQIGCWATTYGGAKTVRNAVFNALDGYIGAMGNTTIQGILKETEIDLIEPQAGLQANRVYGVLMDFLVMATEPQPTLT